MKTYQIYFYSLSLVANFLNRFWVVFFNYYLKEVKCVYLAAAAKSLQSCPTLCGPIDGSPPGSPLLGILQARTLEWVAISFSNAWKWKVKVKLLSRVRLLATPWTAAHQAPRSMGFSMQEYLSGVPLPSLNYIIQYDVISIIPLTMNVYNIRKYFKYILMLKNPRFKMSNYTNV